jgi:hypothetical protein
MSFCAVLSTTEQQTGSSEVVFLKSGSLLAPCSGFTASVCRSTFPVPLSDATGLYSGIREKRSLVRSFSCLLFT